MPDFKEPEEDVARCGVRVKESVGSATIELREPRVGVKELQKMFESDGGFILHPWLGGGDSYLRSPRGSSVALTLATVVLSVLSLASSSR